MPDGTPPTRPVERAPPGRRSTDPLDYQRVPRPVAAMPKEFPDGFVIAPHTHERGQLLFAFAGVMTVSTAAGSWTVPPERAIWVPAGVEHTVRFHGGAAMRTLYLDADAVPAFARAKDGAKDGDGVRVIAVTALLRELILRACTLPVLYDEAGPDGRLMAVLVDELAAGPTAGIGLPMPRDRRLASVCRSIVADPADDRTLEGWAEAVGASARTLARLFRRETGMGFAAWRQQARLQAAVARLAAGAGVTEVALDLGYDSPSAFTAMFRRTLGQPPRRYVRA